MDTSALLPSESLTHKQHPLVAWSKNSQLRFQPKFYTYTPKPHQKTKKRQPSPHSKHSEPEEQEEDAQRTQLFECPMKLESSGNSPLKELEKEPDNPYIEVQARIEVPQEVKVDQKPEEIQIPNIVCQQLIPVPSITRRKPKSPPQKRIRHKEKSESSEWIDQKKKKSIKKTKKTKKSKKGRKSKLEKREKRVKNERIVIKLF